MLISSRAVFKFSDCSLPNIDSMRFELLIFLLTAEILGEAVPISWNLGFNSSSEYVSSSCEGNVSECQSAGGGMRRQKQSPLKFYGCMLTEITVLNQDFAVLVSFLSFRNLRSI